MEGQREFLETIQKGTKWPEIWGTHSSQKVIVFSVDFFRMIESLECVNRRDNRLYPIREKISKLASKPQNEFS